jgi:DNA (cytosine-5)-methyltransferase 1
MDMTEAAELWGVEAPIKKRDRKNGLRKRKQHEIEKARLGARINSPLCRRSRT